MSYSVSIIIPVYNAQEYLEECINSIIKSLVFNKTEVLLIDDGSKDSSGEICDSFSAKYENIKTFHIANGGVSNARNVALAEAHGEYITFCDADDYYINDILTKALDKLDNTKSDLLFFEFLNEDANHNCSKTTYPFDSNVVLKSGCNRELFKFMLSQSYFNSLWNKFFKRELINNNSILFNKEQKRGGDRDFVIRFLSVCKSAFYMPETGYFYRYVKTSIVNKPRTDHFDNICVAYDFKVKMAPTFNVTQEELKLILEPAVVAQIVSRAFSSVEYGFSSFSDSLNSLFENEKLMGIVKRNKSIGFKNFIYEVIRRLISQKKLFLCWILIKSLSQTRKIIYKLR